MEIRASDAACLMEIMYGKHFKNNAHRIAEVLSTNSLYHNDSLYGSVQGVVDVLEVVLTMVGKDATDD